MMNSPYLRLTIHYLNPICLALKEDSKVTSNTILMLLAGISMAATIGERVPCTAKESPIILYKMESVKLAATIILPDLAYARNWWIIPILLLSIMASQAGENCAVLSLTAIPVSLCIRAPASFRPSPNINTFYAEPAIVLFYRAYLAVTG